MQQEIDKIFFDFEIIAFEFVVLNNCFYWERILVISCQYVNKQSQDFRYYQKWIFRLIFFQSEQEISEKYCRADKNSAFCSL